MRKTITISRKQKLVIGIALASIALVIFIVVVTVIQADRNKQAAFITATNPGGTGGDYWPPNTIKLDYSSIKPVIGEDATNKVIALLEAQAKKDVGTIDKEYSAVVTTPPGPATPPKAWNYGFVITINTTYVYAVTVDINPDPTDGIDRPLVTITRQ